jgi:aminopeptidase
MFSNAQLERYADVLLWGLKTARTGRFRKGDIILIRYHLPAVRLAEILYKRVIEAGMHPVIRAEITPGMELAFYSLSENRQLVFEPPGERALYENINGSIFLYAPESITHLGGVDSAKIGKTAVSRKYIRDIYTEREEKGLFSWTLCAFPTEELARHARLSVKEYADQIAGACFLNRKSSVEEWQTVHKNAMTIKKWLNRLKVLSFHVESKNVDLVITPGDRRRWIGISGHNIPSFELFLSPDWRGTAGVYFADQPSYRSGNYVEGVRLEFKKGAVAAMDAKSGQDFVAKQLIMDRGASRLGEFSLTDKRFSRISRFMANTLFDENFGGKNGNCHVALGSAYSDTYSGDPGELTAKMKEDLGFNDSALHWDLVNTEKKRVTARLAGGKTLTIYEDGMFKY